MNFLKKKPFLHHHIMGGGFRVNVVVEYRKSSIFFCRIVDIEVYCRYRFERKSV